MSVKVTTKDGTFEGDHVSDIVVEAYGPLAAVSLVKGQPWVSLAGRGPICPILRVEGHEPRPLNSREMWEITELLDECMNWSQGGFLDADLRARIFAVVESPTQETWSNACSIIVTDPSVPGIKSTLWQLLLSETDYACTGRQADG